LVNNFYFPENQCGFRLYESHLGPATMSGKPLVQIIGSLNSDLVIRTQRVPESGETLTADSYSTGAGGKGANQAVACGRAAFASPGCQDVQVGIIGAVGANDVHVASVLRPILDASGVYGAGIIECEGAQTGVSTIMVDPTGENRIIFYPGANYDGMRGVAQIIDLAQAPTGNNPDVVVMQGEIPLDTTAQLLRHFNQPDVETLVVFNPAPLYPEGIPANALLNLAFLIVNETECVLLAQTLGLGIFPSKNDVMDLARTQLDAVAGALIEQFKVKNFIVTLGGKGAYFASQKGIRDLVPSAPVHKVVDTTAAGDTFAGYFAVSVARYAASRSGSDQFDIKASIEEANRAAAYCVQKEGSMLSIPYRYEIK
jgi:ribokinase